MTGRRAAGQLELNWPQEPTPAEIADRLRSLDRDLGTHLPPRVEVKGRRNRSTLGSLKLIPGKPPVWRLSLDARLLEQDPRAALDLGCLLLHRARRREVPAELGRRLAELRASWPVGARRRVTGLTHDPILQQRLEELARRYMPELGPDRLPAIAWVDSASRRVMGRFDQRIHRIELHVALRHPTVPKVVLDNLIFHELLHALLKPERQGGRLVHHHAEFRRRERAFPGYLEAVAWSRTRWPRLVARHLRAWAKPAR